MTDTNKRARQIDRYYLDKKMARKHCEDIEAYLENELRAYIKYASNHILDGSLMTHRQRVDFVRGWMRSWLDDRRLHLRVQKPKAK
tara:strand:+ start:1486 stop:1743 length:258 start_codon:yes stop_codon:yes gene_type:complete